MTVRIAFLADPHLCIQARRRNFLSLCARKPWRFIDASRRDDATGNHAFSPFKPTSYDDRPLLAAADRIAELSRSLNLLVLLGDLATTGKDDDLFVAEQVFLDQKEVRHLTAAIEPRFGGLGVRVHVVPGNHDRYKDDVATPGGKNFDRVFQSVYQPNSGVCLEGITVDDVSVALISADFCYAEDSSIDLVRRYGWGTVDQTVLSELDFRTRLWQRKNPGKPVIWALHFSPGEGVSITVRLEKRELVLDLAVRLGVKHIFCGHTHFRKREVGTHPHIYCSGSVSSVDSRDNHFLHICEVTKSDDGHNLEVFDFRFDEEKDRFLYDPVSIEA
jgi:DNA repair exonuclease SbcCD nuclease subunit